MLARPTRGERGDHNRQSGGRYNLSGASGGTPGSRLISSDTVARWPKPATPRVRDIRRLNNRVRQAQAGSAPPAESNPPEQTVARDEPLPIGLAHAAAKVREFPQTPGVYLMKDAAGG